ncbi:DUF3422 family protein [Marinobacterium arenosum]|uniref:DUF3422 family protein n=1 Tax=Marinobacterium arenosum TaxID=2862496 RepID=UPI001C97FEF5|nr:DUF3422 domain-containing protein [Marinobacterium arenosum]MBY4678737.1 DUF3422 domain-containing protein [Marinobacterium arenosum]
MTAEMTPHGLALHPLRDSLYAELHSRPFQVIGSPARITQIAVVCDEADKQRQFEHLAELCRQFGIDPPVHDDICLQLDFGNFRVRREKHMEFASYTFVNMKVPVGGSPFDVSGISPLPEGWLARLPGSVVAAFHVSVEQGGNQRELMLPLVKRFFEGMRLVGSSPQQGDARVWTTFQLHSDGFGRFLVYNKQMSDSQLGRLVQRLMEIETYRLMALLALPTARRFSPQLAAMDDQLAEVTRALADGGEPVDERALLAQLTDMAARVEACRAESTFRFSATQAYHELVVKRLDELREDEVSGHLTISEFMTRRLTPAVRTCHAIGDRLEDLSRRIDRVADMMRTRVELSIQAQNQQLLASMDRRSRIQLMMQHTVEGLSVAAISYYAVGLVKYLLEALYGSGVEFDKSLVLGISVPVIVGTVWFATRRIHRRFIAMAKNRDIGE